MGKGRSPRKKAKTHKRAIAHQKINTRKRSRHRRRKSKAGICRTTRRNCRGELLTINNKAGCLVCDKILGLRKMHHCRLTGRRICQEHTIQVNKGDKTTLSKLIKKNSNTKQQVRALMPYFMFVNYLLQTCGIDKNIKICSDVKLLTRNLDRAYLEDAYNDEYAGRALYKNYINAVNPTLPQHLRLPNNPTSRQRTPLQHVQGNTRIQGHIDKVNQEINQYNLKISQLTKQIKEAHDARRIKRLKHDLAKNKAQLQKWKTLLDGHTRQLTIYQK